MVESRGHQMLRKGLDRIENNLDEMMHIISVSDDNHLEITLNYNPGFETFDYILILNEDDDEPIEREEDDGMGKEEFLEQSRGDEFFLIEIKNMDSGRTLEKLYQDPKGRWKDILPAAKRASKKITRNRVYSEEVLGFPKNVSNQIAHQSYFGKSRDNFRKEISYLRKLSK